MAPHEVLRRFSTNAAMLKSVCQELHTVLVVRWISVCVSTQQSVSAYSALNLPFVNYCLMRGSRIKKNKSFHTTSINSFFSSSQDLVIALLS